MSDYKTTRLAALKAVAENFEIRGPDVDGIVWLILHGAGTSGKGAVALGHKDRIVAQVALMLEQDRAAATVAEAMSDYEAVRAAAVEAAKAEFWRVWRTECGPRGESIAGVSDAIAAYEAHMAAAGWVPPVQPHGGGTVGGVAVSDDEYLEALAGKRDESVDCPRCHGKGGYLMGRDAHRSEGWVQCRCDEVIRRVNAKKAAP